MEAMAIPLYAFLHLSSFSHRLLCPLPGLKAMELAVGSERVVVHEGNYLSDFVDDCCTIVEDLLTLPCTVSV